MSEERKLTQADVPLTADETEQAIILNALQAAEFLRGAPDPANPPVETEPDEGDGTEETTE